MGENFVDLYTLQKDIRDGLGDLFPDRVWVKAEIAQLSVKSGGHCYLSLVQSERGNVIAKVRGVIWKNCYTLLSAKFRSATGTDISAGTEVLVRAMVSFHEVFGLSLVIDDIDISTAVGEQQLKRQQTIERLTREGLMDRQQGLRLPELPYSLAVVSAVDAAGLQDFLSQLTDNPQGFVYRPDLFSATMQGEAAPDSIRAALADILESPVRYDAVLILRGGGSDMDLVCFDDYDLAVAIARMPIPVVTAIGHDKDFHVADMVAYDHVKTPTALADMFLRITEAADARISSYEKRLAVAFRGRLASLESALLLAERSIGSEVRARLAAAEAQVSLIETKIAATDPRNVLRRGFSLVLDADGVKITSAKGRRKGEKLSVLLDDGRLRTEIKDVELNEN